MNSKWHLYISIGKSLLRMIGCVIAIVTNHWMPIAVFFFVAEGLGIMEEIKDER
ncbi:MAG: hypothetical protein WDA59_05065 [Methanofastidiosum sp.]|jgi:hypothetical protein